MHVFFHNDSDFVKAIDMPSCQHLSVTSEDVSSLPSEKNFASH